MTPVTIVSAQMHDLPAVLALERVSPEAPHWTEAQYQAILSPTPDALARSLLTASTSTSLVGFAVVKLAGDEAELETIAVDPSHRRSGIGRALGAAVIAWAWQRGALRMELEVRTSSEGAIALYRSLGFTITGRRARYYAQPEDDAVLMRLERCLN